MLRNRHQKDMCLKGVGLRVQNMLTILGLSVNLNRKLYDNLMSMRIFRFDNERDIHTSSKTYEVNGCKHDLEC